MILPRESEMMLDEVLTDYSILQPTAVRALNILCRGVPVRLSRRVTTGHDGVTVLPGTLLHIVRGHPGSEAQIDVLPANRI